MQSAFTAKELLTGDTPVFLFECSMADGTVQRWSSQTIQWSGNQYDGRVLRHNLFEAQLASDTQIGGAPKLAFELANADSHFSEIEQQTGFKGSLLIVRSLFVDTATGLATTDAIVVFRGLMNPPDLITESTFRLSAMNRMSMQRTVIPEVRVQRLCPWRFPTTADQRQEAVDGTPTRGKYSPFYRCGYSPDQPNGVGNLDAGVPFTSCAHTRADCETHGMFTQDSSGRATARFGGIEYVPATILVRGTGQKNLQLSNVQDNQARYNDSVPLIYGTQWHTPDVVFSRNDGNLTRMEVLVAMGEIQGILKVLVNDIEIPQGVNRMNMTATGWWNLITPGTRNGQQDPNFGDGGAGALGDPYGSMAYLSVVVPNRINDGSSIPTVQLLLQGMKLMVFDADGNYLGGEFNANPSWVLLDILLRSGYRLDEINTVSFATAAAYCDETILAEDPIAGAVQIPRFSCNFALKQPRSAGEIIRSLRNSSRLYLVLSADGLLEARIENTFALQQPAKPDYSNSTETFNEGWPAYEFDSSSIARNPDGSSSLRLSSKGAQDTPNRLSVEFQDQFNQYQQDSMSLADGDDADLCGQEVAASWDAMGISNFSQASRMLQLGLNRGIEGNRYVEFDTSVKALGLIPGDLITITYLKENLERTPFRILKITPGSGFRTATISAQYHIDEWYFDDVSGMVGGRGWQSGQGSGLPNPVGGTVLDANGALQLGIAESEVAGSDGAVDVELSVAFTEPSGQIGVLPAPLIDLVATVLPAGGTLAGGVAWFYAVSSVDSNGGESPLSFIVQVSTDPTSSTNSVVLDGIGLPRNAASFHVYRGLTAMQLFRIASNMPPAAVFTDTGLAPQPVLPPDPQFDHVNLYWRWELLPEAGVTSHSPNSVENASLQLNPDQFKSAIVRITRGRGAAQERQISGNTATDLTVDLPWTVEPDATSFFVIAENSWRSGAKGNSSPLAIDVPERIGSVVQVSARAANSSNDEASYQLSPLTRWTLGQSGGLASDADVPPAPNFAVQKSPVRGGTLELSAISFSAPASVPPVSPLLNTRSITAGTYRFHYYDELTGIPIGLGNAVAAGDTSIRFVTVTGTTPGTQTTVASGSLVQIDQEIILAGDQSPDGSVSITRGMHSTEPAAHDVTAVVYPLKEKVTIVPFIKNFFGSPASGDWKYSVDLPNARLASAELYMTNSLGNGAIAVSQYTDTYTSGLRTLAGGQFSFQIAGYLAIQNGAAPDIIVDANRSVGEIFAVLRGAADGIVSLQLNRNNQPYGDAIVFSPPGSIASSSLDGFNLPVLAGGDKLSLNVTGVGATIPGNDLTVIIGL